MIKNITKNTIIAENELIARSLWERGTGLICRKFEAGKMDAMIFDKCSSLHTFFMKYKFDVFFLDKSKKVITLYESILDDGNCGFGHYALSALYTLCVKRAAKQERWQEVEEHLKCAYEHNKAYLNLRAQGGEFRYTAPLVENVTIQVDTLPPVQKWEEIVQNFPECLRKHISCI